MIMNLFELITITEDTSYSIYGGISIVIVFISGWLLADYFMKKYAWLIIGSFSGVLLIFYEYKFILPASIWIEHSIIFIATFFFL